MFRFVKAKDPRGRNVYWVGNAGTGQDAGPGTDFHAVAEVFLGGEWHLVDATGMAKEAAMAKIGVGRDAGDVAFLTAYGQAIMNAQSVMVTAA